MQLETILLQQGNGSSLSGLIMIVAMIAIFYFLMIRPQSKQQKKLKNQRDAMQNGDRVVTAGGIHGKIKEIADTTVLIEVSAGVTIKVDKGSVYPVVEEPAKKK
jgi:preprotein translocase subunit YajC